MLKINRITHSHTARLAIVTFACLYVAGCVVPVPPAVVVGDRYEPYSGPYMPERAIELLRYASDPAIAPAVYPDCTADGFKFHAFADEHGPRYSGSAGISCGATPARVGGTDRSVRRSGGGR